MIILLNLINSLILSIKKKTNFICSILLWKKILVFKGTKSVSECKICISQCSVFVFPFVLFYLKLNFNDSNVVYLHYYRSVMRQRNIFYKMPTTIDSQICRCHRMLADYSYLIEK